MKRWNLIIGLFLITGCSLVKIPPLPKTPEIKVVKEGVFVSGDAKTAPEVKSSQTDSVMPIPEGSTFVFNEKLGTMVLTVSKATQIALNRTQTDVKGPIAFDPPKQPTVKEVTDAKADFWTTLGLRVGVFIGCALAIYGLVEQWKLLMIGGGCIAGASLFGLFQQAHPLLLAVIGIGLALCFAGPYIYHTVVKPLQNDQTPH